MYNPALSCITQ